MSFIQINRTDGGVSILWCVPGEESLDAVLEKWKGLHVGEYVSHKAVSAAELPPTKELRDAWVPHENGAGVCCSRAKELLLKDMRRKRNKKLQESDARFVQALEKREGVSELKAERQALRDLTEPLKALDPAGKINDQELLDQMIQLSLVQE